MFDSIISWYKNDPKANVKILYIVTVTILLICLIAFIVIRNSPNPTTSVDKNSQSSIAVSDTSLIDKSASNLQDQNLTNRKLVKVSDNIIGNTLSTQFNSKNEVIYSNEFGKFFINSKQISDEFRSFPVSTYIYNNNLIINEANVVSVVNLQTNKFYTLNTNFYNLIPFGGSIYSLEKSTEKEFIINKYENLPETGKESGVFIAKGELNNLGKNTGLARLGKYFTVFDWTSPTLAGTLDIYVVDGSELKKASTINSVSGFRMFTNKLLISTLDKEDVMYFDFEVDSSFNEIQTKANQSNLNQLLTQNDINPNLSPRRCNFKDSSNLFCLVKTNKNSSQFQFKEADEIIKIDLKEGKVSKVYNNLILAATTLYWNEADNTHYIVSAVDGRLYKIVTEL